MHAVSRVLSHVSRLAAAALCAGMLALSGAASAQNYGNYLEVRGERLANLPTLVENYRAMVYGGQAGRWNTGVRVFLIGDTVENYLGEVRTLLGEFAALTGVSFSIVTNEDLANLRIYFWARAWFNSQAAHAFNDSQRVLCFTNTRTQNGSILQAFVVIPKDLQPRASRACLAHELMHAIGFGGHPPQTFDSALRKGIAADRLTTNDRIIIRARYDDRLRNANSTQAMGVATQVLGELLSRVQEAAGDARDVLAHDGVRVSKDFDGA
jgi:hypothetical protein